MNNSVRQFKYFDTMMSAFVMILIVSNIASSAKIVDTGINILGTRLIFDGGTLIFPLSYILGDVLTEVYGFRASRRAIWTGFGLLALASALFFMLGILPGETAWEEATGGGTAYSAILGGMSTGGIVLASLAGFFTGEFVNAVMLSRIKVLMRGKLLFVRTIASTLVGELLDTVIFTSVAILCGVFPHELFMELVTANYILKCSIEIVFTPVTYILAAGLKKTEHCDAFDMNVLYTPFG
ncbi:MAG: queuosine precursor transporter [Spirochaetaceae bacterium]|jgi:uncharacterized integral membrane protein (TIGR00697 family)|nr:queuosine precursor transporter [Spirochaetaceae bacterium]